jgi:hypothetical protein
VSLFEDLQPPSNASLAIVDSTAGLFVADATDDQLHRYTCEKVLDIYV